MPSLKLLRIILLAFIFFKCGPAEIPALVHPSAPPEPLLMDHPMQSGLWSTVRYPDTITDWVPRFVSTGVSSGIMIEYTGFKTDKPVNARFAFLEIADLDKDSGFVELRTRINDLRQAFFTVDPGQYIVRHVTPWAEQKFFRDVTVKEGEYSIISVTVLIPSAAK